jgi:hypothetical protein
MDPSRTSPLTAASMETAEQERCTGARRSRVPSAPRTTTGKATWSPSSPPLAAASEIFLVRASLTMVSNEVLFFNYRAQRRKTASNRGLILSNFIKPV